VEIALGFLVWISGERLLGGYREGIQYVLDKDFGVYKSVEVGWRSSSFVRVTRLACREDITESVVAPFDDGDNVVLF